MHETTKLNAMLKAEEARNAAVLGQLRSLMGTDSSPDLSKSPFAFLTSSQQVGQGSAGQPLTENVQYALSQLPALRQHLEQLKESPRSLPNARVREEDDDSEKAKRRRYLDSQSRRALQRRGVEPEDAASIAAGRGRKIGKDEVEGIEAVVQALGSAGGARKLDVDMEE